MAISLTDRLRAIRLLLLDVDGVLTDGAITYTDTGAETKTFHVKDGLGIRMLQRADIAVGIVTGRRSDALRHRCRDLDIDLLFDGVADKAAVLSTVFQQTGFHARAMAFMGDDLPDLPLMREVGTAITVADAAPEVIAAAHLVTKSVGGQGAVREVGERILKAQHHWETTLRRYRP